MNLRQLLKRPISNVPKWAPTSLGIIALLGFIDATYLAVEHFANEVPPCVVGNCEIVLTSRFSEIAGVPVSLLGALYYLTLVVLIIIYIDTKKEVMLRSAMFITVVGFVASIWFVSLQAFVIGAYCQFCLISAALSTALFVVSIWVLRKYRVKETSTKDVLI
jgi:uncharacterized membrane protein